MYLLSRLRGVVVIPNGYAGLKYSRISLQLFSSRALPPMAFVDDDRVKEVYWIIPKESKPPLISRDCLISGKINLTFL